MKTQFEDVRPGLICVIAVLLAIISSAVAKVLLLSIAFFTNLFYFQRISVTNVSPADNHLGFAAILVPIIGGLIIGYMARYGSKAIRGHGIPEAMENVLLRESRIPKRIVILKPLSAAISIGSGGPFGAEGPIIATGGALGSLIGRLAIFNRKERKVLLACGAAAGMSAIFGTPLAAVLLSIELLLFEFSARTFIPVAVASGIAAAIRFGFTDSTSFLAFPSVAPLTAKSMIIMTIAGAFFGLVGVLVTKIVYFIEDQFERLPLHWMWWPAIGGLAVGAVGIIEPKSLGVGYQNIQSALDGNLLIGSAAALVLWKFVSWAISLSSGTSGGTLAPLLTIGSLSGLLLGHLVQPYFPDTSLPLMALVGMAATFAGASRSLLASVLFAVEATQQSSCITPLLIGCSVSYLVSHFLMPHSIMTEKIARRGVHVPHEYHPISIDSSKAG